MPKSRRKRNDSEDENDQKLRFRAVAIAALLPECDDEAETVIGYVRTIREFCGSHACNIHPGGEVVPFLVDRD